MNISYGVGDMLDINMIKELWVRKFEDVASEIAVWDSVASEYLLEEKNNFKEDPFLQFMEEKIQLSQNMEVLDVGCGAGAYSCRIAERAGNVTGVDFSPRMIEEGQHYVERNHIKNVQFLERNWHQEHLHLPRRQLRSRCPCRQVDPRPSQYRCGIVVGHCLGVADRGYLRP